MRYAAPMIKFWLCFVLGYMSGQTIAGCTRQAGAGVPTAEPIAVNNVIDVRGLQPFSQPIVFPVDGAGRPADFGILGQGVGATLFYTGTVQPAIVIRSTRMPDQLPAWSADQRLENVRIVGGAVAISGGGKYVHVRNVEVSRVPAGPAAALSIDTCDGLTLQANVHDNQCPGISLRNCHSAVLDLTSRVNLGAGIALTDCHALTGRLYSEANTTWNFDLAGCTRSRLMLWAEQGWWGNAAPPSIAQGRLRACWQNLFHGMDQAESLTAWDADGISRVANRDLSDPARWFSGSAAGAPLGQPLNTKPLAGVIRNFLPAQLESADGLTFMIHAGAFAPSAYGPGVAPARCLVELRDPSETLWNVPVAAGDWLVVEGTLSSPDWQFLGGQKNMPTVRLTATAGGAQTDLGQNLWITAAGPTGFTTAPFRAPSDGSGVRIFCYVGPGVTSGPDRDVRFTISDVAVRRVARGGGQ